MRRYINETLLHDSPGVVLDARPVTRRWRGRRETGRHGHWQQPILAPASDPSAPSRRALPLPRCACRLPPCRCRCAARRSRRALPTRAVLSLPVRPGSAPLPACGRSDYEYSHCARRRWRRRLYPVASPASPRPRAGRALPRAPSVVGWACGFHPCHGLHMFPPSPPLPPACNSRRGLGVGCLCVGLRHGFCRFPCGVGDDHPLPAAVHGGGPGGCAPARAGGCPRSGAHRRRGRPRLWPDAVAPTGGGQGRGVACLCGRGAPGCGEVAPCRRRRRRRCCPVCGRARRSGRSGRGDRKSVV